MKVDKPNPNPARRRSHPNQTAPEMYAPPGDDKPLFQTRTMDEARLDQVQVSAEARGLNSGLSLNPPSGGNDLRLLLWSLHKGHSIPVASAGD